MRRQIFVLSFVVTTISASPNWDLFATDDVTIDNDIDSALTDDMFASDSGFDSTDDSLLNVNGGLSDFQFTDENLAIDGSSDCSSSSPLRRNRARTDSCSANPSNQPSDPPLRYLEVKTAEDVEKYWCSKIVPDVIPMNIPVCMTIYGSEVPWEGWAAITDYLERPGIAPKPSGILNVFRARLSKSTVDAGLEERHGKRFEKIDGSRYYGMHSRLTMSNVIVTPANYIICADNQAYCCFEFVEADRRRYGVDVPPDEGTGFYCSRATRVAFHP